MHVYLVSAIAVFRAVCPSRMLAAIGTFLLISRTIPKLPDGLNATQAPKPWVVPVLNISTCRCGGSGGVNASTALLS